MTGYRTHGFDIALEVPEGVVGLLTTALLPELLTGRTGEIATGGATGTYEFLAATDAGSITLATSIDNGVGVEVPFLLSCAFDTSPGWPTAGTFAGRVSVTAPLITTEPTLTTTCLALDFRTLPTDRVQIVRLDPLSASWAGRETAVRGLVMELVRGTLRARHFFEIPPTIPIDPENDGSEPFTPRRMEARVINDGTTRSVVGLLVTSPLTEGDSSALTTSALAPGDLILCMFGNELLLRRVIGMSLLTSLEVIDPEAENAMEDLAATLEFSGSRVTLASPIDIRHLIDQWWATSADLRELAISVTDDERIQIIAEILAGGPLIETRTRLEMSATLEVTEEQVVVHWRLEEPDVVITASVLVWVLLGPLAAAVLALKGVASRLMFGAMETLVSSDGFTLVSPETWPEEPQAVDVDCTFDVPLPLPIAIERIALDDWGITGHCPVPEPSYEWPAPSLEILGDWRVTDTRVGGMRPGWAPAGVRHEIVTILLAHEADFVAVAHGLALPVSFAWCLGGQALSGEGRVTVGESVVSYVVEGSRCHLSLELGTSLLSELAVSALDARGTELFATRAVDVQGSEEDHGFSGVGLLEGPLPTYALRLVEREPSPAESLTVSQAEMMFRTAFQRGMGVDPFVVRHGPPV